MDFNPDILRRYFNGNYSGNDYRQIKSVFGNLENRLQLKHELENHWNEYFSVSMPDDDTDNLLKKIHRQIMLEEKVFRKNRFLSVFQKIAAILIIPLILAFFALYYFSFNEKEENTEIAFAEIVCPMGVRTRFQLPDGTTGYLNSGSRLKFPAVFSSERDVSLTGEAFFDVVHDNLSPFMVHTAHLSVKVLGTQFNVVAYDNENKEEVILTNGRVEVLDSIGNTAGFLLPDEKMVWDAEKKIFRKMKVEAVQFTAWTEGKLVFRNESLESVAERMGRWYNVDIEIADSELLKYAFRATFIDEPLEEVLKLLALTAPFYYEEEVRKISSDDVFQKRKVYLKLDKKKLEAFH